MKKYDVITIGDCSQDIFVFPHESLIQKNTRFTSGKCISFELGDKINLDKVSFQIGGSAGNTAVAFSRLGLRTAIVTPLGFDMVADKIIDTLQTENVDINYLDQKEGRQSNFSVIFNLGSERTIFVYHGLEDYSKLKVPKSLSTKWIYLSPTGHGEDELINKIVTFAAQKSINIAWNPGARQIEKGAHHFRNLLRVTSILSLNKEEAIKFTNFPVRPDIKELSKRLCMLGVKIVLITDGRNGAYCYDGQDLWYLGILPAERVDATGAGDSFTAAFVSKFIENEFNSETIESAMKYAIVESTSVISHLGAQTGLLTKKQIEDRLSELPRLKVEEATNQN